MAERTVLVLDDDPGIRAVVRQALERPGFTVEGFEDPAAFRAGTYFPPDRIILLDLRLGTGNGVEVLRFLAANRCRARIVLMSGADARLLHTVEKLGLGLGLNVVGVLRKPFRRAELFAAISAAATQEDREAERGRSFEQELHRAIAGNELLLHYQPKVEAGSSKPIGAEALVRWQHPDRGLLFPVDFIAAAEETGVIVPMTHWVLNEAVAQVARWRAEGLDLPVSVNIPAAMIADLSLPKVIGEILSLHGVPGSSLALEITEAGVLRDLLSAIDAAARLRLLDVGLSVDDFGTGHASIIKLRQLPFTELKIDRSFVRDLRAEGEARALVESMVAMGHLFGLTVVAEGVEDADTLSILSRIGCDVVQGYHLGRPMPPVEYGRWIETQPARFSRPAARLSRPEPPPRPHPAQRCATGPWGRAVPSGAGRAA